MKEGYIHVYTGDGKGKTTASLGLILRAIGRNLKVGYISFHKDFKKWKNGEFFILEKMGVTVKNYAKYFPMKVPVQDKKKIRNSCKKALTEIKKNWHESSLDLLVIDELNVTLNEGYLTEDEVIDFIKCKPKSLELIITGRNAKKSIVDLADLVTEMKEIKHYFKRGIAARKGIEY